MRIALAALVLVATTSTAHADRPWKRRAVHLSVIGAGGAGYILVETVFKPSLIPDGCRWCAVDGLDLAVSDGLRWSSPQTASRISDVSGFIVAPAAALSFLYAVQPRHDALQWLDDAIPVVESTVATGLIHHLVKFIAGRQRPLAYHAGPGRDPNNDDNMSFFSGHTSGAFALAAAAGTVAHLRGYRHQRAIWVTGLTIATGTGYLRMAADKHWATDVVTGAAIGLAVGVSLPRLLHHETLTVVPTGTGVLVSAAF